MALGHIHGFGPAGGDLQGYFPNPTLRDSLSRSLAAQIFGSRAASSAAADAGSAALAAQVFGPRAAAAVTPTTDAATFALGTQIFARHSGRELKDILDFIGNGAQGDILYRDANSWQRLAAGTSGKLLQTNGTGANPSWTSVSAVSGTMSYQGSATVSGAAATDLTISGLDLDTYGIIYFEITADNGSGSTADISIYLNSDTTATNYYNERITSVAGTVGGTGGNNAIVSSPTTTQSFTLQAWMRRNFDGFVRTQFILTRGIASARTINYGWHLYETSTNVTGITVHSSVASALSIGSKIKVWAISNT